MHPLAEAVFKHLASERGENDPLGSLARTVLDGSATPREAAAHSWHSLGLLTSLESSLVERDHLDADEKAEFEDQAAELLSRFGPAVARPGRSAEPSASASSGTAADSSPGSLLEGR